MASIKTTRRLIEKFAEEEPWKQKHDKLQDCWRIEEKLVSGIFVLKDLMERESRVIRSGEVESPGLSDIAGASTLDEFFALTKSLYAFWTSAAKKHLRTAERFQETEGYAVDGIEEFRQILEETECMLGNIQLESELNPAGKTTWTESTANPDPARYGDY